MYVYIQFAAGSQYMNSDGAERVSHTHETDRLEADGR